jgi:hydroxymethylpyrimidine kinase/phosphomethylpyrimidine kinase
MSSQKQPVCLSIAGLDPSGGAGILADIKTFAAFGCFGAGVVTSITFQNTVGVFGAENVTADAVRKQVEPVFDDYDVGAVKTGMLPTREIIETVATAVTLKHVKHFVVDPVVRSTSGFDLIDDDALRALCEKLFPLAAVVTPNLPEAERITGVVIDSPETLALAGSKMLEMNAASVLIKGGHSKSEKRKATDTLFTSDGVHSFDAEFIDTTSTHGTGCTLSSAIASNLALGHDLIDAIRIAKGYVTDAIRNAPGLGRGHGPVDHLVRNK